MLKKATIKTWKRLRGPRPRWFGHPAVIAILAGLLIADFISIPGGFRRGGSTLKTLIEEFTINRGRTFRPRMFPATFVTDGERVGMVWTHQFSVPGGVVLPAWDSDPDRQPQYRNFETIEWPRWHPWQPSGVYHMTEMERSFELPSRATPQQRASMMSLFIEQFDALPPGHDLRAWPQLHEVRRLYAQGKTSERTTIPIGYYRNAVALTLLALLVLAYAKGRTDLWLRSWRDRLLKRRQPWQCTNCGYDTRGLKQCPECGRPAHADH